MMARVFARARGRKRIGSNVPKLPQPAEAGVFGAAYGFAPAFAFFIYYRDIRASALTVGFMYIILIYVIYI